MTINEERAGDTRILGSESYHQEMHLLIRCTKEQSNGIREIDTKGKKRQQARLKTKESRRENYHRAKVLLESARWSNRLLHPKSPCSRFLCNLLLL